MSTRITEAGEASPPPSERPPVTVVHAADLAAYRLRPDATNRLATIVAPGSAGGRLSLMLEIFDVGGRQEPNSHPGSDEIFYFIDGEGRAHCDGEAIEVRAGDVVVLPAGSLHFIENTGPQRLYALTTLVNDDGSHDPAGLAQEPLEEEDLAVLAGSR